MNEAYYIHDFPLHSLILLFFPTTAKLVKSEYLHSELEYIHLLSLILHKLTINRKTL